MEFNNLKKYIQLKEPHSYELGLLCRYSHQNFRFRFLQFSDGKSKKKHFEKFAIFLLRFILSWVYYSKYYVTSLIVIFIMVLMYVAYPFIYFAAIALAILLIYIPVLMIKEEIERYEIFFVNFESRDGKTIDEKCFRNIILYDDVPKIKALIKILKRTVFVREIELQKYKEKMDPVLGYASDRLPGYDVIKAFIQQEETFLLIK